MNGNYILPVPDRIIARRYYDRQKQQVPQRGVEIPPKTRADAAD